MTPPTVNPAFVLREHQRLRIPHISVDSDQWICYMYSLSENIPDFWDAWHYALLYTDIGGKGFNIVNVYDRQETALVTSNTLFVLFHVDFFFKIVL